MYLKPMKAWDKAEREYARARSPSRRMYSFEKSMEAFEALRPFREEAEAVAKLIGSLRNDQLWQEKE